MKLLTVNRRWFWPMVMLVAVGTVPAIAQEEEAADTQAQLAAIAAESPAAATLLELPRDNPVDATKVVLTLLNLRERTAAELVLEELLATDPSKAELASIARSLGTARMLELAGVDGSEPLPGAREFAQRCLDAAADLSLDPQHLEKLIAGLTAKDLPTRFAARKELASSGAPAAAACFAKLATASEQQTRAALLETLAEMHPVVDPLLIAVLADSSGQLQRDAAELAGHLNLLEATPWLATLAAGGTSDNNVKTTAQAALQKMGLSLPSTGDAIVLIRHEIERLGAGIPIDPSVTEEALWWSYSPEKKQLTSTEFPEATRRKLAEARLSRNLLTIPADPADELRALVTNFEAAHLLDQEPDQELVARLAQRGVSGILAGLDLALSRDLWAAAITCIRQLEKIGAPAALEARAGMPSALVRAVREPDAAVKFAALQAIMNLKPEKSFAGASYVTEALWSLAAGAGTRQAVVGAPSLAHANDWAGMLRSLQYDATPASTGIELVKAALAAPRIELILVDSDIGKPLVREVLYQIRAQPKLAGVPVAILSSNPDLEESRARAELDDLMLAVSRPRNPDAMRSIVDRIRELKGESLSPEERLADARQAIEWLGQLFAARRPYSELQRDAELLEKTLYNPQLSESSIAALATVGTAGSQQALVDFASQETQPLELREAAAAGFAKSFKQFGCLLTADQINRQYERYNASEHSDESTQQLLGTILDVLERKEVADSGGK